MIGANLRFGIGASGNVTSNATKVFQCHPGGVTEATVIFSLGALGMGANIILMALILVKRQLRRYDNNPSKDGTLRALCFEKSGNNTRNSRIIIFDR